MTIKHVFCSLLSCDWQVCVSSSGVVVSGQNIIRPHAVPGARVVLLTLRVWLWRAGRAQSQVQTLVPAQRCNTQLLMPRSESCQCQHEEQTRALCQHPLSNPKVTHTAEWKGARGPVCDREREKRTTYIFGPRLLIRQHHSHAFGLSVIDAVVLHPCGHEGTWFDIKQGAM